MENTARLPLLVTAFALIALAAGEPTPALGASFTVNATHDAPDATPGDGVCADAGGACTFRAALDETNALPGADAVSLPAGTYPGAHVVKDSVQIAGAGAAGTILSGPSPEIGTVLGLAGTYCDSSSTGVLSIEISGISITGGQSPGGGIRNCGHSVLLNAVVIRDNGSAGLDGGGIWNAGNLTIRDSTIANNWAYRGAAILNDRNGTVTVSNSTISANRSVNGNGAISNASSTPAVLENVTALGSDDRPEACVIACGPIQVRNTILAVAGQGVACGGPVTTLGHNLSSDSTCNLTGPGDLSGVQPQLTGLQENGGPTPTHGLYPNSPAIDAGDPNACPPADQRGIGRPQGATCDIGAYEYVPPAPRPATEPPPADTPPPPPPPTSSPTANPTLRIAATPSPSPPTLNLGPTATATQRRVRKPMFTPTLIDAPPVEEEAAGTSVSFVASSMMAVGVLGLIGTAIAGGYYWRRRRRGRRPR